MRLEAAKLLEDIRLVVYHDKTWDIIVSELPTLLREVTAMLATPPDAP